MANVAMLSTSADLSSSQSSGVPAILMPTGAIIPFGGATAPSGWLICDGSAISRTTYSKLFTALNNGTIWGTGDGSTTFNVPNLTGAFLRGIGTNGIHAGPSTVGSLQSQATAKNGLSASTSGANQASGISGSANGGVNLSHTHSLDDPGFAGVGISNGSLPGGGTGYYGRFSANGVNPRAAPSASLDHSHSLSGTAGAQSWSGSTSLSGDSETRPNSIGINYIIKT